jgi:diketogulonate reductase-like aldo/keto reductase
MKKPEINLSDKYKIPQIGLGLWQVRDVEQFNTAFAAAIEAGYRHFDTAQAYDNEHMLGEAWKKSGQKRGELFITTKIAVQNFGHNKAKRAFGESLQKLQTEYVDLLLLHFPVTLLRKKAWLALEEIHAAGGARSIGVSNYTIRHLKEMKDYSSVMPTINQVELHAFLQQPELVKYCNDNGIVVQAYSPLAHGQGLDDPVIAGIARKHRKSPAQIMLRWLIEQDFVVIPKSVTPSRIQENIQIFDFQLDTEDLEALKQLDKDLRTCWNPTHVP